MPYALAGHVFVCREGEHVVFLDVRKDRYFALEAAQTSGLGQVVPGWPVAGAPDEASQGLGAEGVAQSAVLGLLLERGLLCEDTHSGKPATPVASLPPGGELTADALNAIPSLNAKTVLRFIVSAATASLVLKVRRLERVIDRVQRRNRASVSRQRSPPIAADRVLELVATFASLRPFFFTSKDACLFEALALSEFLARHEIYPRWVFGVQARPFAAHCWLQQDDVVLNDTVEHVSAYTPILFV